MAKKLEKTNNEQQSILETPEESGMVLDDEVEEVEDFDLEDNMDEDGNIIDDIDDGDDLDEPGDEDDLPDDGEDDADIEDDEEEVSEDSIDSNESETEEQPVSTKKGKRKLTPADIKVINLKKENQKLLQKQQELERQLQEKAQAREAESLQEQYVAQGYDEDTAKNMAANELRIKQIEQRQAVLDFRDTNEEVFDRYPEAKKNVADIMQKSKASGLTAEQICIALYGQSRVNPREARASAAARGEPTRQVGTDRVSQASRSAGQQESITLTATQRREKQILERTFNKGQKMTNEEYLRYSKS